MKNNKELAHLLYIIAGIGLIGGCRGWGWFLFIGLLLS